MGTLSTHQDLNHCSEAIPMTIKVYFNHNLITSLHYDFVLGSPVVPLPSKMLLAKKQEMNTKRPINSRLFVKLWRFNFFQRALAVYECFMMLAVVNSKYTGGKPRNYHEIVLT